VSDFERALAASLDSDEEDGGGALDGSDEDVDDFDDEAADEAARSVARAFGVDLGKVDISELREALRTFIRLEM
jgi:hypothetical protein